MLEKIVIIGSGTMGHGIAQVSAMAGYKVVVFDSNPDALEKAEKSIIDNLDKGIEKQKIDLAKKNSTLDNLNFATDLENAVRHADLVIEAVPEILELKRSLFEKIDELTPEYTILATNTSSLSIADIASVVSDPSRVIGLHFFNPVHIMELLEIVYLPDTTGHEVISASEEFAKNIGKESILVKNSPGFATSRLGVAIGMEAIRMLEEGVASAEDIDKAMVLGYRHPVGPLKLTDMVGLDVRLAIATYLAEKLQSPVFTPPQLLKNMVANGKLGKKSKEGFYRW
jgi:3-hydroxybutyryl-CoA dehydrogenase